MTEAELMAKLHLQYGPKYGWLIFKPTGEVIPAGLWALILAQLERRP